MVNAAERVGRVTAQWELFGTKTSSAGWLSWLVPYTTLAAAAAATAYCLITGYTRVYWLLTGLSQQSLHDKHA